MRTPKPLKELVCTFFRIRFFSVLFNLIITHMVLLLRCWCCNRFDIIFRCFKKYKSKHPDVPYKRNHLLITDNCRIVLSCFGSRIFTMILTYTVSTHIKLHSWLNLQYSKIWINLHFFGPKVHFLRLFKALMGKIFNKPPPWYPHILINLRRFNVYMRQYCRLS